MKKIITLCASILMALTVSTTVAKEKSNITTTTFSSDIDCPSCTKKIMNVIPFEKGVKDVKIDLPKKEITVKYDNNKNSDESLTKSFEKLKIKAKPIK
ncbi:MAG: heavy-metal-associated domain-containing protein [Rikenellaceae bacterium]